MCFYLGLWHKGIFPSLFCVLTKVSRRIDWQPVAAAPVLLVCIFFVLYFLTC